MYRMSKLLMAAVVVIVSANPVFALTRDTSTRAVGSACLEQAGSTANLDRVRLPDMRSNFTNEGSLLMWVKLRSNTTSTTTGKGGLSEFGTAPYGTSYPYIDGSVLIGELSTARPSLGTLSGVDKTVWHQLAMTIDSSGTYKIYQNGTLSHTAAGQRFSLSAEPLLGGDSDATIHLDGWMDDVQLYSTALSGTDISELYASPGSTKTGLVGRWDFEDAGRPWDDSSGNGHHGISDVPAEIAPIHAPFEMPQLKRPVFADRTFNIVDYGAKGDGTTKNTTAFGEAIAACHKAGGGKVLVPAGKWLTGAIHLKSHVNLHMEKDAEIHFSDDPQDYLPVVFTRWAGFEVMNYSPLIYANGCENIAVTGPGKLYGHGKKWWGWNKRLDERYAIGAKLQAMAAGNIPVEERVFGSPELGLRPEFINPVNCRNVLLEGFTVAGGGPFWTIQFLYCENVIARKLTIHTLGGPNNDGINLDSTRNALVEHCFLNTEDDAVAIKSGMSEDGRRVGKPSENIVVRHCYSKGTGWGGLAVGSDMSGDVRNVFVEDVTFDRTKLGIFLKSNRERGASWRI